MLNTKVKNQLASGGTQMGSSVNLLEQFCWSRAEIVQKTVTNWLLAIDKVETKSLRCFREPT